jgi:hypothetical protein
MTEVTQTGALTFKIGSLVPGARKTRAAETPPTPNPAAQVPTPPPAPRPLPAVDPDSDVQRAIYAAYELLDDPAVPPRERRAQADNVILGLLARGWTIAPPGQPVAWGFRVPGQQRVYEGGERATHRAAEADPNLEVVTEVRLGWRKVTP